MKIPPECTRMSWEVRGSDGRHLRFWRDGNRMRKDTLVGAKINQTFLDLGSVHPWMYVLDNRTMTGVRILRSEKILNMRFDPDDDFDWEEEGPVAFDGREAVSFVRRISGAEFVKARRVIDCETGCRMKIENFGDDGTFIFEMSTSNLRVGAQEDSVFEVPNGFQVTELSV